MIWTIPNILTMLRVLAAPCVALAFVVFERPLADWVAFGLFAGAALTDYLDGWLARSWGQESEIGKMLDPIADKAMVIIALMVLVMRDNVSGPILSAEQQWIVMQDDTLALLVVPSVLIVLRETLVSGLREYLGDIKLRVTQLAKWKTTAQMVAIGILLAVAPLRDLLGGFTPRRYLDYPEAFAWMQPISHVQMVGVVLLWVATAFTVISGIDYFRKGLVELRKREVKG
ncbi:MAG: CDP-alcohol phosphatidyltransferase family protein [Pseudomonadota bacterium]